MAGDIVVRLTLDDLLTPAWNRTVGAVISGSTKMNLSLGQISSYVFNLKSALVAVGGVAVAKSFVSAAASAEQMRMRLTAVLGGSGEAADQLIGKFEEMAEKFAVTDDELTEAFIGLRSMGITPTIDELKQMAGVAGVCGRDLNELSAALVVLNERSLRNFGVQLDKVKDKATISVGGITKEVQNNNEAIRQGIMELWGKAYPDALEKSSATFRGQMKMLGNQWEEFQESVMEAGLFDFIKDGLKGITGEIKQLKENGKLGEYIRDTAKMAVDAFSIIAQAAETAINTIQKGKLTVDILGSAFSKHSSAFLNHYQTQMDNYTDAYNVFISTKEKTAAALDDTLKKNKDMSYAHVAAILGEVAAIETLKGQYDYLNEKIKFYSEKVAGAQEAQEESYKGWEDQAQNIKKTEEAFKDLGAEIDKLYEKLDAAPKKLIWQVEIADKERKPKPLDASIYNKSQLDAEKKMVEMEREMEMRKRRARDSTVGYGEEWRIAAAKAQASEDKRKEAEENRIKAMQESTKELIQQGKQIEANAKAEAEMARIVEQVHRNQAAVRAMLEQIGDVLTNNIMQVFDDLISGQLKTTREYIQSILKDLTRMAVETTIKTVINLGISALGLEKGGLVEGGLGNRLPLNLPVRSYGAGGMTEGPELAAVGEGRNREAIVPLPDNRTIPVTFKEPGTGSRPVQQYFSINLSAIDTATGTQWLLSQESTLENMLYEIGRKNPALKDKWNY